MHTNDIRKIFIALEEINGENLEMEGIVILHTDHLTWTEFPQFPGDDTQPTVHYEVKHGKVFIDGDSRH